MKGGSRYGLILLLAGVLLLAGCDHKTPPTPAHVVNSSDLTEQDVSAAASASTSDAAAVAEALQHYQTLYQTQQVYADSFVSGQYLLIGAENIVGLFLIPDYQQATLIARTAVERIETAAFEGFAAVAIFDKTGQSVSVILSPDDADEISRLLQ